MATTKKSITQPQQNQSQTGGALITPRPGTATRTRLPRPREMARKDLARPPYACLILLAMNWIAAVPVHNVLPSRRRHSAIALYPNNPNNRHSAIALYPNNPNNRHSAIALYRCSRNKVTRICSGRESTGGQTRGAEGPDNPNNPNDPNNPNNSNKALRQKWQPFLLDNEEIVFTGLVKQGRYSLLQKKRQLILTDFPRFVAVDIGSMAITARTQRAHMHTRAWQEFLTDVDIASSSPRLRPLTLYARAPAFNLRVYWIIFDSF